MTEKKIFSAESQAGQGFQKLKNFLKRGLKRELKIFQKSTAEKKRQRTKWNRFTPKKRITNEEKTTAKKMNGGRKKQARKKKTAERKNPPRPRRAKIRPADYANHPKKAPESLVERFFCIE